jgi:hypothetical protein
MMKMEGKYVDNADQGTVVKKYEEEGEHDDGEDQYADGMERNKKERRKRMMRRICNVGFQILLTVVMKNSVF